MTEPQNNSRTILVTGAAGFIGGHLIRRLAKLGYYKIYALDRVPPNEKDLHPAISFIQHRLGKDPLHLLDEAVGDIDYVIHLAALKHQQSSTEKDYVRDNIDGTLEVLEIGKKRKVKKVVFSSSLYAHGGMEAPALREDSCAAPLTIYGSSKLCGENLMAYVDRVFDIPTLSLRYFFVYGPGQYAGSGYKSLLIGTIERILCGRAPLIFGDGLQALDYVYIDDVIDATIAALDAPARGTVINVGSGNAYTVNYLVGVISELMECSKKPEHGAADWTHGTSRCSLTDRAQKLLTWKPRVTIEDGLRKTIDWIKEHRE